MPVATDLLLETVLCHGLFTVIYVYHVIMLLPLFAAITVMAFIKNARLHDSKLFSMNAE